jgi:hypothetical protein
VFSVELGKVEEDPLVKVGFTDSLIFQVNEEHLGLGLFPSTGSSAIDGLYDLDFYK